MEDCFRFRVSRLKSLAKHLQKGQKTEMTVSDPKFLTYPEAADFLRCSEKTLYNRVRDGKIRPFHNGRKVLFTEEMLTEFLQRENDLTV